MTQKATAITVITTPSTRRPMRRAYGPRGTNLINRYAPRDSDESRNAHLPAYDAAGKRSLLLFPQQNSPKGPIP
jgi:hypothetical protein